MLEQSNIECEVPCTHVSTCARGLVDITQVSESAAKEYQIEEALTKMEGEWKDSRLEIVGYRETGTGILKGVDEINTVLDEQVNWREKKRKR